MYNMYYNNINKLWKDRNQIIMMDTDSFILNIKTDDIFKDLETIKDDLDTSDYSKDHYLFSNKNKK